MECASALTLYGTSYINIMKNLRKIQRKKCIVIYVPAKLTQAEKA